VTPAATLDAARVGRDGALTLRFEQRGAATVVAGCRYTLPLQVLAPVALDDPAAIVSILNPTGGLVGGDRLSIDVHAAAGAHSVGPQAVVEWVPDHTIPFAGSALRQSIDVDLAETAGLILVDAFSAGRIALGEAWRFAALENAVSVRDGRGWLLQDRFVLRGIGTRGPAFDGLGFTESHPYFASIAVFGAFDCDRFAADVERLGAGHAAARLGAGVLPRGGVLVRCLAPAAPALVDAVEGCWRLARRALLGLPPLALRKS